jgi:hypothetical protein
MPNRRAWWLVCTLLAVLACAVALWCIFGSRHPRPTVQPATPPVESTPSDPF